ncbi:sensor histidine kinase [Paenibacillus soyae]|uniref:histidine kinase n=1 Tax=Paenibacillus soyae TaxID=2969249 RepID=A0A9X2S898_9BACL|nr:HAMP domain-containing histidine kinase [Paenibacillus soyae]
MEALYVLMFASMWTMGVVFLIYGFKKNFWIAMTLLTGGTASFAFSIHLAFMPLLLPLDVLTPFWSGLIYQVSVVAMSVYFYAFPFAAGMGGLWLGAVRSLPVKVLITAVMATPSVWLFVSHLQQDPWNSFTVGDFRWWSGFCFLFGGVMYAIAFIREPDSYLKRGKRRVAALFSTGTLWAFVSDFVGFRTLVMGEWSFELESNGTWQLNAIVILALVAGIIYSAAKYGILGVKVKLEKERLDSSMRALTMGVSILNHSIKNEIQKINYLTEKTQGYIQSGQLEKSQQTIEQVHAVTAHLLSMVGRIKDKADDIVLKEEAVSVDGLLAAVLKSMMPILESRAVKVELKQEDGGELVCDAMHMAETLSNLVHNAVDAMEETGGLLRIRSFKFKKHYVLEVKDNGSGIPKEHLARIFEPFYTTKKNTANHGLGLSYCVSVMRKHGGDLRIEESEAGKGTAIWLMFPVKRYTAMPATGVGQPAASVLHA